VADYKNEHKECTDTAPEVKDFQKKNFEVMDPNVIRVGDKIYNRFTNQEGFDKAKQGVDTWNMIYLPASGDMSGDQAAKWGPGMALNKGCSGDGKEGNDGFSLLRDNIKKVEDLKDVVQSGAMKERLAGHSGRRWSPSRCVARAQP